MFQDRYMPDDDASDEFELTRADRDPSPRHHSHKHKGKHRHHREDREPKQRASGHGQRGSEELEDGEIEDGEIDAVADGEAQLPAPPSGQQHRSGAAGNSNGLTGPAADVADGKHRYHDEGRLAADAAGKRRASSPLSPRNGAGSSQQQQPQGSRHQRSSSSRPPSGLRSRSRSRSRSRPRSSSRDRSRQQRSSRGGEEPPAAAHKSSSRPPRDDRSREGSREHGARDSSRGPAAPGAAAGAPGRERERERHRSGDGSSREQRERQPRDIAPPGGRDSRDGRDHRDRDRERDRDGRDARYRSSRDYDAPAGFRQRQAARERERERGGGDRGGERDHKRRSRSRSRSRGYCGDEQRHKRSRDADGRDGERRRRRSSEEQDEAELDIDPADLMAVDALGLSAAEREAEEEALRLEESRKRRQAILAKHQQSAAVAAPTATAAAAAAAAVDSSQPPQVQSQQLQPQEEQEEEDGRPAAAATPPVDGTATPEGERSSSDDSHNAPGSPVMDIWNRGDAAVAGGEVSSRAEEATSQLPVHLVVPGTEPNMQSERLRVVPGGAQAPAAGSAATASAAGAGTGSGATASAPAAAEAAATAAAADDMFADVDDDMFAAAEEGAAAGGAGGVGGAAGRRGPAVPAGLMDNYDDAEGYYNFQVGEVLDGRYEVFACKGKGVFSTVLRARDKLRQVHPVTGQLVVAGTAGPAAEFAEVAIKVIRSNETMAKAAALEQRILRLLSEKDPDNKKHVIRLLRTFEYRQHVCMVFEPMDMNLRELTLKYGRNVGLNITAVAIYAAQLLVALRHLQQCRVLHADIKPDNILVNARRSKVKICDLGSAMLAGENERTPYLISRFYRAPEVILGLAYDFPMDMWSVGCVLYELFTGKILFPGRSNNEMLKLMMDVKGPFPKKMLKKGIFVEKHFEDDAQLSFALLEEDPVTKQPVRRVIPNPTAKHNFSQLLARAEGDRNQVAALADLLERMLALDPDKRIEADAALRHPFVKPWLPKKKAAGAGGGGG